MKSTSFCFDFLAEQSFIEFFDSHPKNEIIVLMDFVLTSLQINFFNLYIDIYL